MKLLLSFLILLTVAFPLAFSDPSASELSPADTAWKNARAALDAKQYQKAQPLFDDFIRRHLSDPRAQEARIFSAICDYRQKRVVNALVAWNRIVNMEVMQKRSSPALLLALDQLAAHHRVEGKPEDWKKTVDQLFEFFPENPITIRELRLFARHCLIKGDYVQSLAIYGRFEKQLSAEDRQNLNLARAMAESGADGSALVKSANDRLELNEPELAAGLYGEALKMNLRDDEKYEAMTKLGWCLYLQNKHKQAESLWQQAIKESSKGNEWAGQSRWHMIQLLAGPRKQEKKAIELCDVQAAEFAGSFRGRQAAFTKAWLYWVAKDWEKARKAFDELILGYPEAMEHEPIRNYIRDCEQGLNARK